MANVTYFLSQNPVINNFQVVGSANPDKFIDDTSPSSRLSIKQSGPNVIITDGTYTATFTNFAVQQLTNAGGNTLTSSDGSTITVNAAGPGTTALGDYIGLSNGVNFSDTGGGNDLVYGNQGDDTLRINVGSQTDRPTVYGGKGNDTIFFGNFLGPDPLNVNSGQNIIYGNLDNDVITGGNSADTIYGGQGNDTINASGGNDLLRGDKGNDQITGGNGNDTIYGGIGGDTGPDDDTILTGTGNNLIYGNTGNDTITLAGKDSAYGGKGDDTIAGAAGGTSALLIYGNIGADKLTGGTKDDTLYGGKDNDVLNGLAGNDFLSGDLGNDILVGGDGADKLSGGSGTNFFDERDPLTTANPTPGQPAVNAAGVITANVSGLSDQTADTITDFVSGSDKIVTGLVDGDATNFQTKQNVNVTTAAAAATYYDTVLGVAPGTRREYTLITGGTDSTGAKTGYLVIDSNAGGLSDEVIKLTGDPSLKAADIIQNTNPGFNP